MILDFFPPFYLAIQHKDTVTHVLTELKAKITVWTFMQWVKNFYLVCMLDHCGENLM